VSLDDSDRVWRARVWQLSRQAGRHLMMAFANRVRPEVVRMAGRCLGAHAARFDWNLPRCHGVPVTRLRPWAQVRAAELSAGGALGTLYPPPPCQAGHCTLPA
jgi:hypothetical protein